MGANSTTWEAVWASCHWHKWKSSWYRDKGPCRGQAGEAQERPWNDELRTFQGGCWRRKPNYFGWCHREDGTRSKVAHDVGHVPSPWSEWPGWDPIVPGWACEKCRSRIRMAEVAHSGELGVDGSVHNTVDSLHHLDVEEECYECTSQGGCEAWEDRWNTTWSWRLFQQDEWLPKVWDRSTGARERSTGARGSIFIRRWRNRKSCGVARQREPGDESKVAHREVHVDRVPTQIEVGRIRDGENVRQDLCLWGWEKWAQRVLVDKVWACRAPRQGLPQDEASQTRRDHWLEGV